MTTATKIYTMKRSAYRCPEVGGTFGKTIKGVDGWATVLTKETIEDRSAQNLHDIVRITYTFEPRQF